MDTDASSTGQNGRGEPNPGGYGLTEEATLPYRGDGSYEEVTRPGPSAVYMGRPGYPGPADAVRRPPTRPVQPWEGSPFGHSVSPTGPAAAQGGPPARPDLSHAVYPNPGQWQPIGGAEYPATALVEPSELVKAPPVVPQTGWRKAVYDATAKTVNLGPSASERRISAQEQIVAAPITGTYQIAVLSTKGGVGKTRTTAALGTVFAIHRTEPVIAIDASPNYGGLGPVIDPVAPSSMREWTADSQLITYPAARRHTGKNRQGLEVLGGNQNLSNPLTLDADLFDATLGRSQQFYQLSLIDCGSDIDHPVMAAVLSSASALVLVATAQAEHARAAGQAIQWLAARNAHDLLRRTVVVVNDAFQNPSNQFFDKVSGQFRPYVQAVKWVPWDPHVRDSVTLDFDLMRRRTQLAYLEIATELALGFRPAPQRDVEMERPPRSRR